MNINDLSNNDENIIEILDNVALKVKVEIVWLNLIKNQKKLLKLLKIFQKKFPQ